MSVHKLELLEQMIARKTRKIEETHDLADVCALLLTEFNEAATRNGLLLDHIIVLLAREPGPDYIFSKYFVRHFGQDPMLKLKLIKIRFSCVFQDIHHCHWIPSRVKSSFSSHAAPRQDLTGILKRATAS